LVDGFFCWLILFIFNVYNICILIYDRVNCSFEKIAAKRFPRIGR
jgi:hypothetical protein